MEVNRESLAALGRAHVAFGEQLAWFVLESFERGHPVVPEAASVDAATAGLGRSVGDGQKACVP
jgi:hypothetical protein